MNAPNTQIGNWLGRKPPATEADLLRIVEERLAPTVISRLISLGLQRSEIDATVIPLRTLQHRRSRREKLTVEESDRVLRTLSLAESVNGTRQRALEWLRKAHPRLGGACHCRSSKPILGLGLWKNCWFRSTRACSSK